MVKGEILRNDFILLCIEKEKEVDLLRQPLPSSILKTQFGKYVL